MSKPIKVVVFVVVVVILVVVDVIVLLLLLLLISLLFCQNWVSKSLNIVVVVADPELALKF